VEGHLFGAPRQVAGCSDAGPLRLGMHLFVHNMASRLERPKETERHPLGWLFFVVACQIVLNCPFCRCGRGEQIGERKCRKGFSNLQHLRLAIDSDGICCQAPKTQPYVVYLCDAAAPKTATAWDDAIPESPRND